MTREQQLLRALQEIARLPYKPFPDPGAHSWQAYAKAINSTYHQMRRIALAAQTEVAETGSDEDAPDLLSIVRRWSALDGGRWHAERYHRERAELLADTKAAIAKVEGPPR